MELKELLEHFNNGDTLGEDPAVIELMRFYSREAQKTVFLSTHDLELALQVADTVWLMTRQNGIQIGTPHELAQSGALSQFIERSKEISFDRETLSVRVNS